MPIANGARAALSFVTHLVIVSLASASYLFIVVDDNTHIHCLDPPVCFGWLFLLMVLWQNSFE